MGNTTKSQKSRMTFKKNCLHIFLSHKLGQSKNKARAVAKQLTLLANDKIKITYSADFTQGTDWHNEVTKGLEEADWFILLYDGPEANHDWCLYEAGFFRKMMCDDESKRLFCIHDPRHNLPNPLKMFNHVPAKHEEVRKLFEQIYLNEPWAILKDLFSEGMKDELERRISSLIASVLSQDEIEAQFTLSPSFTVTLPLNDDDLLAIKQGRKHFLIPNNAEVAGEGQWEAIFGKPPSTIAWSWDALMENIQEPQPWIHRLQQLMFDSMLNRICNQTSTAIRVKIKNSDIDSTYRVILRNFEKTKVECRFSFVASKFTLPFESEMNAQLKTIFHLYNMSVYFRWQFLEKNLARLHAIRVLKKPDQQEISEAVADINRDVSSLTVEAQVRGVEDLSRIVLAFPEEERDSVSDALQIQWPHLFQNLINHAQAEKKDINGIIASIEAMRPLNDFFLKQSSTHLTRLLIG
jgi:hypothetical protein